MNCLMTYKDESIYMTMDEKLNKIFGNYKIDIIRMLDKMTEKFPEASVKKVRKIDDYIYVSLGDRTELLLSAFEEEMKNAKSKEKGEDEK